MWPFKKESIHQYINDFIINYRIIQHEDTRDEPYHLQSYDHHRVVGERLLYPIWSTIAIFKTLEEANIFANEIKNGVRDREGLKIVSTFKVGPTFVFTRSNIND